MKLINLLASGRTIIELSEEFVSSVTGRLKVSHHSLEFIQTVNDVYGA